MGYESVLGYPLFACRSMCCREDNRNQMEQMNVELEDGRKRRNGIALRAREHMDGLYSAFDNNLAVFLLENPRKHRHSWFTIKRLLIIGAVWVCEEGALVVHEEVTRFSEAIKYKLLVDEGQGQSFVCFGHDDERLDSLSVTEVIDDIPAHIGRV